MDWQGRFSCLEDIKSISEKILILPCCPPNQVVVKSNIFANTAIRFDFENGTTEIVKLADWDTVKSNVFAKTAIRYIQGLPEARLLKSVAVPFWKGRA